MMACVLACSADTVSTDHGAADDSMDDDALLPMPECDDPGIEPSAAHYQWFGIEDLVWGEWRPDLVLPGGDLLSIDQTRLHPDTDFSRVARWAPGTEPTKSWSFESEPGELFESATVTPTGDVYVTRTATASDNSIDVLHLDAEGQLVREVPVEHALAGYRVRGIALAGTEGFALHLRSGGARPRHRIVRYDADFVPRWIADSVPNVRVDVAADIEGNVYIGWMEVPGPPAAGGDDGQPLHVNAYDERGRQIWSYESEAHLRIEPILEVGSEGRVFVLLPGSHPVESVLLALTPGGERAWQLVDDDLEDLRIIDIAPSPCGGLFAVGDTANRSAGFVHIDGDGTAGPVEPLHNPYAVDLPDSWAVEVSASALGDVLILGSSYTTIPPTDIQGWVLRR